ncbi:MAG: flagellar hook capping FlgD N-terminal domain-containing protein [Thermodesulfovibrio sp.]
MSNITSIFENPTYLVQEKKFAKGNNQIDKTTFLKLLAAQLKYQDPLNPLSNTEFVGQLAMFSALEQIINIGNVIESMAKGNSLMLGANIIGKKVITNSSESYTITAVSYEDGKLILKSQDKSLTFDEIKEITT